MRLMRIRGWNGKHRGSLGSRSEACHAKYLTLLLRVRFPRLSQEPHMNEQGRWSRIKHRGSDPKGDRDALERAKKVLGLVGAEHKDHLLYLCPCSRCVEENIVDIATKFNARTLLMEGAPRKKTVAKNLRRVSEAA